MQTNKKQRERKYQTFTEIGTLHDQWAMSVDIYPLNTRSGWSNVLHVGIGGDHATYGDRTPGIWFHSDWGSKNISIRSDYMNQKKYSA